MPKQEYGVHSSLYHFWVGPKHELDVVHPEGDLLQINVYLWRHRRLAREISYPLLDIRGCDKRPISSCIRIGQDASQEFQHNGPRTVARSYFIPSIDVVE